MCKTKSKEVMLSMDGSMIKHRAKRVLSERYWLLVGIFFIYSLISSAAFIVRIVRSDVDLSSFGSLMGSFAGNEEGNVGLSITVDFVELLFSVFVVNVLAVGAARISLKAYRGESFELSELFYGFNAKRYLPYVGAMALMTLAVVAGMMFCIVPGIVLSIGLAQTPYILAESSTDGGVWISASDALGLSWRMMKGRKGEYFLFELSFIGWILLDLVTLGLADVFYVSPYISIAKAGWYDELRSVTSEAF